MDLKGLNNIGNTCFLNSGLQLILANDELINYYLNNNFENKISNTFKKFISQHKSSSGNVNPIEIKQITEVNKEFIGFRQNDSHEFIVTLLDELSESLKKEKKENIIDKIYGGETKSIVKCRLVGCGEESITKDKYNILSLEIKNTNLDDIYRHFKSPEILENDERWNCPKCKKLRIASKRFENSKWPENVIIHLKRFEFSNGRPKKNNDNVDIPIEWRHNYKLKSFVIHRGGFGGGHYICAVKKDNDWYLCNDETVSKLTIENVEKIVKQAYILLYSK